MLLLSDGYYIEEHDEKNWRLMRRRPTKPGPLTKAEEINEFLGYFTTVDQALRKYAAHAPHGCAGLKHLQDVWAGVISTLDRVAAAVSEEKWESILGRPSSPPPALSTPSPTKEAFDDL